MFSTDFGGRYVHVFAFWSVRGVLLLGYNQGLGQAASDIFIGWYLGYFICPSVAAGSTGRHSEFDIAR